MAGSLKPGEKLIFGMNGGMYDDTNAPVGLYVEHGVEMKRANTRGGAANFHLKPNGVFFVGGGQAGVWETSHFLAGATGGGLRDPVRPDAGGQRQDPPAHQRRWNLDEIAQWRRRRPRGPGGLRHLESTRDILPLRQPVPRQTACDNALFLDGSISALYAPELDRDDFTLPMGPIVGVVAEGR